MCPFMERVQRPGGLVRASRLARPIMTLLGSAAEVLADHVVFDIERAASSLPGPVQRSRRRTRDGCLTGSAEVPAADSARKAFSLRRPSSYRTSAMVSSARSATQRDTVTGSSISATAESRVMYQRSGAPALLDSAASETSYTGQRFLDDDSYQLES